MFALHRTRRVGLLRRTNSQRYLLSTINLIRLENTPILTQLKLEEALYRHDDRNWCLVNQYSGPPTVVLGISGQPSKLVKVEDVSRDNIPMIRRFSGGGTVILHSGSFLVSFVCRKDFLGAERNLAESPGGLMSWSQSYYADMFRRMRESNRMDVDESTEFGLTGQDYTFGGTRKIGGNAQALSKDRFVHHTSFLWSYDPDIMKYLTIPEKQPEYRANRDHGDFLCRMCDVILDSAAWWSAFESELRSRCQVVEMDEECALPLLEELVTNPSSLRTKLLVG